MTSGADRKASGTEMTLTGSVLEVAPPERLVTTESWGLATGAMDGMNRAFELLEELLDAER